jgi:hypothetical protein
MLRRRGGSSSAAFGLYLLLSFAFFGVRLLLHSGKTYVGIGVDPEIYTWSFAWWPHALLHGQNPLYTHEIWSPDGVDLAWTTTTPALALAFAPLTLLAGPLAAFNVAAVLMPALAAFTAFLLCRHITRTFWPSLVGGYLFGFSSYMLGQLQGHLHLTSVCLLPLVALFILRFFEGTLGPRDLAVRLGVLIALQIGFSTEVAFTLTLAIACALLLIFILVPAARQRALAVVPPLVGGYAIAAVLTAPILYYALTDFHRGAINPVSPTEFSADLLNFVVPTDLSVASNGWTHSISRHFRSGLTESGGYLGIPTVIILAWFALRRWRSPAVRWLVALLVLAFIVSLGSWLQVRGRNVTTMPWEHLGYLPLFNNVLTVRFSVFISLLAAVIVAMWAASSPVPRWLRVLLPALAVLAILPNLHLRVWTTTVHEPSFISAGTYKQCLRRDENTAVFPFAGFGDSMLWQADSDFWFRMTGGYVAPTPPESFRQPPGVGDIAIFGRVPDHQVAPLLQFLRVKKVSAIVVDGSRPELWPSLLRGVAKPVSVGGVLVYRLHGPAPCSSSA